MEDSSKRHDSWAMFLISFGFYFSVFFDPWGPIPRYFGWLLCLIGITYIFVMQKAELYKPVLEPGIRILGYTFLAWSLFVTLINFHGWYYFGKGISIPLESMFAVWIAALAISRTKLYRLEIIWWLSSAIVLVISILAAGNIIEEGVFSNPNTLGLYAIVTLPMSLNCAVRKYNNVIFDILSTLLVSVNSMALLVSFSSGPWIVGVLEVIFFLAITHPSKQGLFKTLLAPFLITVFCTLLLGLLHPDFFLQAKREILQILSVSGDFSNFTNRRMDIWEKTLYLISQKPLTGWGWIQYKALYAINKLEPIPGMGVPLEPHNMYLQLTTYGGYPLILIVVAMMLYGAWLSWVKFKKCDDEKRFLYAAVLTTILAILVYSIAGSIFSARQKVGYLYWVLYGISAASSNIAAKKERSR